MATSSSFGFLGELTIAPNWDALYPFGEFIALLNSQGVLLRPGFKADFRLNPASGDWMICETEHVVMDGFVPEKAASQFADFTGDQLQAVLSGYARGAQRLLDPHYLGFTAGLLAELLPKPVPQVLPLLAPQFDLGRVWQACGASLHQGTAALRLVPVAPAAPPTDEELLLASAVVFVAELDPTAWLVHMAASFPTSEVAQLLGALARGELGTSSGVEWGGLLAQAVAYFQPKQRLRRRIRRYGRWSLLNLFGVVYAQPGQLQALYATHSAFRFLRQTLDQMPADDTSQRGPILLAVRDGLEWLARTAEAQAQPKDSLNFAQLALIAAQLLPPVLTPSYTETWLMHIIAQDEGYGWFRRATSQSLEPAMVWQFAGYAGTEALTTHIFCEASGHWLASGEASNQLWTAAWRGLSLLRTALHNCYALSQQETPPGLPSAHDQGLMLKSLLGNYIKTIQILADMLAQSAKVQVLSMWAGREGEIRLKTLFAGYPNRYIAVRDALAAHGYGPEAIRCLGELVGELQI